VSVPGARGRQGTSPKEAKVEGRLTAVGETLKG